MFYTIKKIIKKGGALIFNRIKMFNIQHRVSFLLIISILFLTINSFSLNKLSVIGYMTLITLVILWISHAYYHFIDRLYDN